MATAAQHVSFLPRSLEIDVTSSVEQVRIQSIALYLEQPITLILEADSEELAGIGTSLSSLFLKCGTAIRNDKSACLDTTYACASALELVGGLLRKVTRPMPPELCHAIVTATVTLREKLRVGSF